MKKITKSFVSTMLCLLGLGTLFAEVNIISPIKGEWSNKQMLVLDTSQGGDFFYSVDGSDPETFGFAYDGPVFLDIEGNINLKVARVDHNSKTEYASVEYTVKNYDALLESYGSFINCFFDTGIYNYSAGTEFVIPKTLLFSLGLPPDSFIQGQSIGLNEKTVISTYVPCTILDPESNRKWRFVIRTIPQSSASFSRKDLPFTIEQWDTINYTDDSKMFKIDSELWGAPKGPLKIDRSLSHIIYWQPVSYDEENTIEFYPLPPKPELLCKTLDNGAEIYYLEGDSSYTMSVPGFNSKTYEELFKEIGIDVFYGHRASGILEVGIFSSSVLQATEKIQYSINKRPPSMPVITSNVDTFFTRNKVFVDISCEEGTSLFVACSKPYVLQDLATEYNPSNEIFRNIEVSDFVECENSKFNLELESELKGAVYYKINAYSTNENNKSLVAEYSVIVDQFNFFYDSKANKELADGTIQHPFTDFYSCLDGINNSPNSCLRIKGELEIPSGEHVIKSKCSFINDKDAVINFKPGANITVKDGILNISNIVIKNEYSETSKTLVPLFKILKSALEMENCQLNAEFGKNATVIDASKAKINIVSCVGTVSSLNYASFISAVKSDVFVEKSILNASSETCVIFSLNGGVSKILENNLRSSGKFIRIAELFNETCVLENNKYLIQNAKEGFVPIYKNKNSKLEENQNGIY